MCVELPVMTVVCVCFVDFMFSAYTVLYILIEIFAIHAQRFRREKLPFIRATGRRAVLAQRFVLMITTHPARNVP